MQTPPGHDPHQNPYLPPQAAQVGQALVPGEKPKWFMFTMVTTMVLGGFGALAGIWAPVNLLIMKGSPLWGLPTGSGMDAEMAQFQEKIFAASMPELTALVGVLNLITGAWALWAALQLVKAQPGARDTFKKALLALGVYEIVAVIVGLIVQYRVFGIMEGFIGSVMRSSSGGSPPPPGFEQTFGAAMQAMMIFGLIAVVVWAGCKIFFAFWARAYVDRPAVIAYAG